MDGWWMDGGWMIFVKFKDQSEPINCSIQYLQYDCVLGCPVKIFRLIPSVLEGAGYIWKETKKEMLYFNVLSIGGHSNISRHCYGGGGVSLLAQCSTQYAIFDSTQRNLNLQGLLDLGR